MCEHRFLHTLVIETSSSSLEKGMCDVRGFMSGTDHLTNKGTSVPRSTSIR